jgi:signal transduction histidine kinase
MAIVEQFLPKKDDWYPIDRLERQLKDYINVSENLIWQRQAIFLAATLLAAFYFSPVVSFSAYAAVLFTEVLDLILARNVNRWTDHDQSKARMFLRWVMLNTVASAVSISLFVVMITLQQTSGGHFTPLFFLFAASLFAAVNNHQLLPALFLRLSIYGVTFVFIATWDIIRLNPPITSEVWLQFFTVAFVMYFIVDCSFVFLKLYRRGLAQIEEITLEHDKTKAALEIKSQFLSTVSHELRTPLTSIKGTLDLVNSGVMGPVPDQMQPILTIAAKNSKHLADLINDLLDLQKIEAGEMAFRFNLLNVRDLVDDSVTMSKGYADQMDVTLSVTHADEEIYINGDAGRLSQVMANLISNASKFSHKGGTVDISVKRLGDHVRIYVKDKGVGIPENAKERVFGRFSQVDSSDQRRVGGTGLGMNISKKIIEKHDGQIDYESTLGHGTTFFIEFEIVPHMPTTMASEMADGRRRKLA